VANQSLEQAIFAIKIGFVVKVNMLRKRFYDRSGGFVVCLWAL
jgi:hypothetical protein